MSSADLRSSRASLPHVLVVDDDNRLRGLLTRLLRSEGFRVSSADSSAQADRALALFDFDALVLDVMMPGEDGFSLATRLRERTFCPFLFLSARADGSDRVHGLELGAVDYLAKPFEPRELILRLQNAIRMAPTVADKPLLFGGGMLDITADGLFISGEPLRLGRSEETLLRLFWRHQQQVMPRHVLAEVLQVDEASLDVLVGRLRKKLPSGFITTVRGLGYRFDQKEGVF